MRLRHQLPVFSPLPFGALTAGLRTLFPGTADPRSQLLERLLARTGARTGVLADSGTSALRLALELIGEDGGGPVALPGFSCYDVATAAVGAEVPVILYDLDPETLSPDPASLEEALNVGARSVVVASLYGFPVDWDRIRALTDRHGAVVVEDAAQAHGALWHGRPWGSHGDLAVMSFGRGKGWTGGGGGALLAHEASWARRLEGRPPLPRAERGSEVASLAATAVLWMLGRPSLYGLPRSIPALGLGETRYREPHAPTDILRGATAVAVGTEAISGEEAVARKAVAGIYMGLVGEGGSTPHLRPIHAVRGGESGYLRFPAQLVGAESESLRDLIETLRPLGLERSYPATLAGLPALRRLMPEDSPDLPGARYLAGRLVTLPTHSRTQAPDREALLARLTPDTSPLSPAET